MAKFVLVLGFVVLFGGKITSCMISNDNSSTNSTMLQNKKDASTENTDLAIHNILIEISNRIFRADDSNLMSLVSKSIVEAAKSNSTSTRASIEAGAKKAQRFVTDVTAAYTQAIFRANTAQEAQDILIRFQDTVQRIVDYAKNGQYAS